MKPRHSRLLAVAALAPLLVALAPGIASAHENHGIIRAHFTPSVPTDPAIFGVKAGGLPWVLDEGSVRIRSNGRTDVRLEGLQVLRTDGSTDNPVPTITASLYCGGVFVTRTDKQPLSVPAGDARFRVRLTVPASCDMATVLINPNGNPAAYIASAMADMDDD